MNKLPEEIQKLFLIQAYNLENKCHFLLEKNENLLIIRNIGNNNYFLEWDKEVVNKLHLKEYVNNFEVSIMVYDIEEDMQKYFIEKYLKVYEEKITNEVNFFKERFFSKNMTIG